jgi:hypothetical protein
MHCTDDQYPDTYDVPACSRDCAGCPECSLDAARAELEPFACPCGGDPTAPCDLLTALGGA